MKDKATHENLRITNISNTLMEDLTNIAKNKGIYRTDFLRSEIRQIIENMPEPGTSTEIQSYRKEIIIAGLPLPIKNKLNRIAASLNMEPTSFLKPHLHAIANSYPEKMKKPPLEY